MLRLPAALAVLAVLALRPGPCSGLPYSPQVYKQATSPGAFIGEGINNIAAALLQVCHQGARDPIMTLVTR